MKIVIRLIILQMIFVFARCECQPEHQTRERTYDVIHYKINVTINIETSTCDGEVSIKFVPLRPNLNEIVLDAGEMIIKSARLEMKAVNFEHRNDSLIVDLENIYGLDDTLTLTVMYGVKSPRKGMYFIKSDSGYSKQRNQVWTQGEAEDNHFWFPCYDFPNDMATSEMIVTVNDKYTAISNGKLINYKKNPQNQTATFHYLENHPHVSYLISLVVGEYIEFKDTWNTVPLSYYVYPEQKNDALMTFSKTPKIMEFFSKQLQYPYPYDKYSQTVVSDFFFGGEENISATTLTDRTIHDSRAHLDYTSDDLVAHELAHQWFGDMITCKDWSHAWLNEGFATYLTNLFVEFDRGKDAAAVKMMEQQELIRNLDDEMRRRPMVCNRYNNPMDLFDSRIYGKGAVVLGMLRDYIGDELFWKVIRYYVKEYSFRCVDTRDFEDMVEDVTGYNLNWFFKQWVYGAGCPDLEIKSQWNQRTRNVEIIVQQKQVIDSLTGIFKLPVDIEIWIRSNPTTYRVVIEKPEEKFEFPAYQQPQCVIFDKGSKILKKLNFERSIEEYVFQSLNATNAVDRIQAVRELQWYSNSDLAVRTLMNLAIDDRFSGVREEAVWALGNILRDSVMETLILAYGDRDSRVRVAAVGSLGRFKSPEVIKTLQHAFEKDSSYNVAAAALKSLVNADSVNKLSYLEKALQLDSYNNVIRTTALRLFALMHNDYAYDVLVKHTISGIDPNLRIHAMNLLSSYWKERDDVLYLIVRLAKDKNKSVRVSAVRILSNLGDERIIKTLKQYAERENEPIVLEELRKTINQLEKSGKDDE